MRLFFALVPDEGLRAALGARARELAQAIGGRPVPAHNVHLTLVFLGEVEPGRASELHPILDAVPRAPFTLSLDRIGEWRHAEVAWIAPGAVPKALVALHSTLTHALGKAGFATETRPFRPHVTLVRRQTRALPDAPAESLDWPVDHVSLVRSHSVGGAVRYRDEARVALNGRDASP